MTLRALWIGVTALHLAQEARGPEIFTQRVAAYEARNEQLAAARDPEERGWAALEWLRALRDVLRAIPIERSVGPYPAWVAAHDDLIVYSEPAGEWLLRDVMVWKTHADHAASSAADEIAWLAATTGLPGECEGEYLRRHPRGAHVDEALGNVASSLSNVLDDLLRRPYAADFFDATKDCSDLLKSLTPLRAAVATAHATAASPALTLTDRLIEQCRR